MTPCLAHNNYHHLNITRTTKKRNNKEASRLYAELLPRADDMHTSGRCADDSQTRTQANTYLSCPILCSTTPGVMCMSSACHLHVIRTHRLHVHIVHTCHLHTHIIHMRTCHPHVICSTPDGQCGPKLSFYSDRNWLLNKICHKNVELFHFRII